jgi:hypothetical protein
VRDSCDNAGRASSVSGDAGTLEACSTVYQSHGDFSMGHATFRAGDLTVVIGDNAADGQHRAGYNGVWSLTHRDEADNFFVPTVAGLNLEHIINGEDFDHDGTSRVFFEPRNAPMTFTRLSDTEAELHQPPTPTFHLESWTHFTLVAPHYVDLHFRCQARQHVFRFGTIAVFWASYINAPDDKSIYFRRSQTWQQLCTQQHNDESTVRHPGDRVTLRFVDGYPPALYRNLSPLYYDEPFYYGNFKGMVAILMFDRTSGIRFTHSPSNPAWDFQFLIPGYEVNREYGFRARLAYRPRCNRAEIRQEVAAWRRGLG